MAYNGRVTNPISIKDRLLLMVERYLVALARLLLNRDRPLIIGITGSVGKTTTKELVAAVLRAGRKPFRATGANLNSDLGVALTVFGVTESPPIWLWPWIIIGLSCQFVGYYLRLAKLPPIMVLEMGIDRLGDMTRLLRTVRPTVGIITWIGEGHHLEYLRDATTVAREKGQLLAALPPTGLAILPAKDPNLAALKALATAPIALIEETGLEAAPAIARQVAKYLKIPDTTVRQAISNFRPPKGRIHRLHGINECLIIDDSYNASLPSVKLALSILAAEPAKRRIAVLGDVLEQGEFEAEYHKQMAALAKSSADLFIAVGPRFRSSKADHWFASPDEAAALLPTLVRPGDVVLVKGSQGMRMEKVSYALAADKDEATAELPRQNRRWRQIPFNYP